MPTLPWDIRPVSFPRDELLHEHPVEWWHFMFRVEGGPGLRRTYIVSTLRSRMGMAGIVMERDEIAHRTRNTFRYGLATWPWYGDGRDDLHLRMGEVRTRWRIDGSMGSYDLDLRTPSVAVTANFTAQKPAILLGDRGRMDYAGAFALGYYCWTDLHVKGDVLVDGELRRITGRGWMEHQWGAVEAWRYRWKYLSMQLSENRELVAFRTWSPEGRTELLTYAAIVHPDGSVQDFRQGEVVLEDGAPYRGYPVATRLRIAAVGLDVRVQPVYDDQRVSPPLPSRYLPPFWEGVCTVTGTLDGAPTEGWAITELAGWEG